MTDTADQLTGVGSTTYTFDAAGRRTRSSGTVTRRFLVASTLGTDLESPHLVANGANTLQQGFVYVGDEPLLRYDASGAGNRVNYLEDDMGSVIGLAPQTSPGTANTSRLFYDGFGNVRTTAGPAPTVPSGAAGDFRFLGLWLESGTGLYHVRARDYGPVTGRFLSRDPNAGLIEEAKSLRALTMLLS